jgi:hypothetical protein
LWEILRKSRKTAARSCGLPDLDLWFTGKVERQNEPGIWRHGPNRF